MATISRNLEQLGRNFALHSGTTQDMCLKNIVWITVTVRALDPGQRFEHTYVLDPPPPATAALTLSKHAYRSHTNKADVQFVALILNIVRQ